MPLDGTTATLDDLTLAAIGTVRWALSPTLADLASLPVWVIWKAVPKKNGVGFDKPPLDPRTGYKGSKTDPAIRLTRAQAEARARHYGLIGDNGGIGILTLPIEVNGGRWQIGCLDTDHCYPPDDDAIAPWAPPVHAILDGHLSELSPSRTGRHHWFLLRASTIPDKVGDHVAYKQGEKPNQYGFDLFMREDLYVTFTDLDVEGELQVLSPLDLMRLFSALETFSPHTKPKHGKRPPTDEHDLAIEILEHLPNGSDYDDRGAWIAIVGAVYNATNASPQGKAAITRWTRDGNSFTAAEGVDTLYGYFARVAPRADIGHLINEARRHGYEPLRKRKPPQPDPAQACTLAEAHTVFRRWLGQEFDLGTLDAVLAVAASERLPGDPVWLLVISGSGNTKTETVQSTSRLGAHIVSTITSDAALLSASPKKQRSKTATGGLLRAIGERGLVVIKDFTSILSVDRNVRATILAALREIHDGRWVRNVGTDGGQTLTWEGRIVIIGACTTAWDQAHAVIATMGDRFVLIRSNSHLGRDASGRRAIRNIGDEAIMRQELAKAAAGVVEGMSDTVYPLTEDDETAIVQAADIVSLVRTGVEIDYRGDVIDAHAPEMPTRLGKQLAQIMRGAIAIGMPHDDALKLVIRCARDCMPPLRLAVLLDVARNPGTRVIDVRRRLQKPRATIDRTLQALHILGLLTCKETEAERAGKTVQVRRYTVNTDFNAAVYRIANPIPEM